MGVVLQHGSHSSIEMQLDLILIRGQFSPYVFRLPKSLVGRHNHDMLLQVGGLYTRYPHKNEYWAMAIFPVSDIKSHRFMTRISGNRKSMTAISSGISQYNHFIGSNCSVLLYPGLHMNPHWMPGTCSDEFIFTTVFKINGSAGGNC